MRLAESTSTVSPTFIDTIRLEIEVKTASISIVPILESPSYCML